MSGNENMLSVREILHFLPEDVVAEQFFLHTTIDSTSTAAKKMVGAGAKHGTVIMAEHQTAGRGRYGRSFHSPGARGIYMSMILDPAQLGLNLLTLVTAFAGVAVCEAIEAVCAKSPGIKWVNDVFLDEKKICGILTEAVGEWLVLGIGINFSASETDFPEELRQIAGAIYPGGNTPVGRNRLTAEVIGRILVGPQSSEELLHKYRQRLNMLGRVVLVIGADQPYEAIALDIDNFGRLIVRKETGETLCVGSGEVSIRGIWPRG